MTKEFLYLFAAMFVFLFSAETILSRETVSTVLPHHFLLSREKSKLKSGNPLLNSAEPLKAAAKNFLFSNPVLLDPEKGCSSGNLNIERFDIRIGPEQRLFFCEALQAMSDQLNGNWSPELQSEIEGMWQVFLSQNIKIRPVKKTTPSNVVALAEAFTESSTIFNASLYLRPEKVHDKSFLLLFAHELRHIYDFYALWKSKSSITAAELEKRGFRIMGKIYQEFPDKSRLLCQPSLWKESWANLSADEISTRREKKIEDFMSDSSFYKDFLKNPYRHLIGFPESQAVKQSADFNQSAKSVADQSGLLPARTAVYQSTEELPQQIKQLSFRTEKAANRNNPNELLKATIANEKNLYRKMDNFVYEQNFQLKCWKKEKITQSYQLNQQVAHTKEGETLLTPKDILSNSPKDDKSSETPDCVSNLEEVKTDATETFWAAPYLDLMPIKFDYFTEINGIRVARYTVFEPSVERFNQIEAEYQKIKFVRVFVGTIFVSVEDAQIIKFWGTTYPKDNTILGSSKPIYGNYCATAIRRKLDSGIWVTTFLNTVATISYKNELRPFSYTVTYENYRQSDSNVRVLDDIEDTN